LRLWDSAKLLATPRHPFIHISYFKVNITFQKIPAIMQNGEQKQTTADEDEDE
jgi:hypothetical protein